MRNLTWRGLTCVAGTLLGLLVAGDVVSGADPLPPPVRWLALGDSYSSGEGIPGANQDPGWWTGTVSVRTVTTRTLGPIRWSPTRRCPRNHYRSAYERPFFVACTGATTDGVELQLFEMLANVPTGLERWNVISLTVGGNTRLQSTSWSAASTTHRSGDPRWRRRL